MHVSEFFNQQWLDKYNTSGPRYTSYPTALEFSDSFFNDDLIRATKTSPNRDLSLYIHIPFCHSLCYYCACNKIVTRHQHKADIYLEYLAKEIKSRSQLFGDYTVKQLHLGGGTPTFLSKGQLSTLLELLRGHFTFAVEPEMGIEVDPRRIELNMVDHLRSLGFNRLSIGVQDIDPKVQKAINRVQSTEFIQQFVARAKDVGFHSVNLDLIYGLPHQDAQTLSNTLDKVKEMDVERISLFNYAHLPSRFAAQRKLRDEWLPSAEQKFLLMKQAVETLVDNGYDFIGMDHFAKPHDELAQAQKQGILHRNFQGYTTKGECDLLGLGVSAISAIGNCYSQNSKELINYYKDIDETGNAVDKGLFLSHDDQIRGFVIKELMCNMYLDKETVSQRFDINFDQYFRADFPSLATFIQDGLVENHAKYIRIASNARLLVRNICMSFDAYMARHRHLNRFSRVI